MDNTRAREVSRVLNELRLNNKDEYFSRRTILSMLESKAKFLLSQKLGEKNSLYRESDLYSHIPCVELEKVESINCPIIEFRMCKTLMRTKNKLPETVDSKFFNNILSVTSLDRGEIFRPCTAFEYSGAKNRKYGHIKRKLYFIEDNYLYIPDIEIYAVNVDLLTLKVEEVSKISSCSKEDCCKSYWDYPLVNSDKLAEVVTQQVIQELVGTVRSIPQDENPNKDSNIKSSTIQ